MKYPTRVSDAVHIMVFIYLNPTQDLSSVAIAYSIKTNPSYVRQLMAALKKARLLNGTRGQAAPSLTREPSTITLLDIYRAVEGNKPNRAPFGYPHQSGVRCRRQYPAGAQ